MNILGGMDGMGYRLCRCPCKDDGDSDDAGIELLLLFVSRRKRLGVVSRSSLSLRFLDGGVIVIFWATRAQQIEFREWLGFYGKNSFATRKFIWERFFLFCEGARENLTMDKFEMASFNSTVRWCPATY